MHSQIRLKIVLLQVLVLFSCFNCLAFKLVRGQTESTDASAASSNAKTKAIYNSEEHLGEPISADAALQALQLPDGFSATLFAAEPDVQNPIAACTDSFGRLWVAENYTYAERSVKFDLDLNDRVVVLEDADNDGVSEKRSVFIDGLKVLTGITHSSDGVWLMCPPQLLFVPDADGDLVPDGPPEVKLDGFHLGRENYHNFANGLAFGPDGWLYGRCGASSPGDIGLPGATDEQRVPLRGGMWRYHTTSKQYEVLVQGTTNPWGHDWNEHGDLFFINTVNGHFWHCIPGAHYVRPHTIDVNPISYELIDMHADHWHFDTGKNWTASRDGAANDYGGGHAHIGMMIYQENAWPKKYHGNVFTVNMHGLRVNQETLHQEGSGYVAKHEKDLLISSDKWFRGMDLIPTYDGNVYLLDWSDTGECHEHTGVHRTSGRIFKLSYGQGTSAESKLDPNKLRQLETLLDGSEWEARKARSLLLANPSSADFSPSSLEAALADPTFSARKRLRALWALIALNAVSDKTIDQLIYSREPELRGWGVRLLVDNARLDTVEGNRPLDEGEPFSADAYAKLLKLAETEKSSKVRLELSSAMIRLPHDKRAAIAVHLVKHREDANDHNLPLMVWYGISPLGSKHAEDLVQIFEKCRWPKTRQLIARHLASLQSTQSQAFDKLFSVAAKSPTAAKDAILGASTAFAGWRKARQPRNWDAISKVASQEEATGERSDVRDAIQNLSILFGDGRAVMELITIAKDKSASLELRKSSLQSLVDSRVAGTKELCQSLLSERFLNRIAVAGLARESDPAIGASIVKNYRRFHPSERAIAISALTTRVAWAKTLLSAVEAGKIDVTEISAFQARQMNNLDDETLNAKLAEIWGQVRATPEEKQQRMVTLKNLLSQQKQSVSKLEGRKLFQKTCSACHTMFGAGGKLGPDLTGAQRSNLDYLLQNIVDPSAVVTKDYRATVLLLEDDRVLSGLLTEQNEKVVTLATQNETYRVPRDEIVTIKLSEQSTMPDGLLDAFTDKQLGDLFSYLQSTNQVELGD